MTASVRRWRLVRAGTDAVPASVRRLMARARRRHRSARARPWALAGAVIALVVLAAWVLWSSSLLGVREVRITGTAILSPVEVREAIAVAEQTPLLQVDPGEVAQRVAALAPVEQAHVQREWPHAVVIEVVERTAAAAVPVGDEVVLVDSHAVVFQTVAEAPSGVPVVVVAEPGPDDPATRAAIAVLAALTPPLLAELSALTVAGPASIRLELHSGRTIVWGDETYSDRKAQVATILLGYEGEVIDVSAPEVVSVR